MMKGLYLELVLLFFLGGLSLASCNKDFLDKRQSSAITIPSTIEDFQKLLDAEVYLKECPAFGEISSDDYYITTENWKALSSVSERNTYIWSKTIFEGTATSNDWNAPYQQVLYSNVVLEGLKNTPVTSANEIAWKAIKGSALFLRAYAFYNLSQIYCPVYDESTNDSRFGIPLRLSSDINEPTIRSTVRETYDRIIADLYEAKELLPTQISRQYLNRPSKPAVLALLSRIYLSMREYPKAIIYADSTLLLHNKLMDYNVLSPTSTFPFELLNDETIYQSSLLSDALIISNLRFVAGYSVDSTLYRTYSPNDLRKTLFFLSNGTLKGSYSVRNRFSGLATDELFLIRAECNARAGNVTDAMKDLNFLLKTRWKKLNGQSTFIDYTAVDQQDALAKILLERRKELVFRGLRWSDLRRLNKEGANITLTRMVDGVAYSLPPNDVRYIAPIPNDVIGFTGIEQNLR